MDALNTITLPSGKVVDDQVGGFIGINGKGEISEGHDGNLRGAEASCPECYEGEEELWHSWSTEDKIALANIMIKRWKEYQMKILLDYYGETYRTKVLVHQRK